MKKRLSLFLVALMGLSLLSCTPNAQVSYRDDTKCAILAENVENKLTLGDGLEFIDKGELAVQTEPYISDVLDLVDDYVFRFTGGNSFDEYAVFHVADEKDDSFLALGSHLRQKRTTAADINFFCKHIFRVFMFRFRNPVSYKDNKKIIRPSPFRAQPDQITEAAL